MSTESVQVLRSASMNSDKWNAIAATETNDLLEHLKLAGEVRVNVLSQGIELLSRCLSPKAQGVE